MALTKITSNMASLDTLTANNGVLELDDNGTHNGIINVPASLSINIDSDNGATTETFSIAKDKTGINDTDVLFRVQEDGKVMVGSTSPDSLFHIESASGTAMTIQAGTNSSASIRLKNDAHDWDLNCQTNDNFAIYSHTASAERFVINTDGAFFYKNAPGSTANNPTLKINTSSGYIYYDSSSLRYKENVEDLPSALSNVNALRPVTFDEISSGESCFGLIAEEVNEVIPELVHLREIDGFDTPQPDSVSYDKLSVFLLKAIQEQQTIIDDLKTRIETLENA